MKKELKAVLWIIIIFISSVFCAFVFNQTLLIYSATKDINPILGKVVLYFLCTIYFSVIVTPFIIILKLPKQIKPPNEGTKEYKVFIRALRKRMESNSILVNEGTEIISTNDIEYIQDATKALDKISDDHIKEVAKFIFVSTAISQNGAFDALIVLISQIRMVWKIAHIYNQRPSIREMTFLYTNVAATALIVNELDDFEFVEEQLGILIPSLLGSSLSSVVPGVQSLALMLVNSIIQGSANAFLTLRVGCIAKKYCRPLFKENKRGIRKMASTEACALLGGILADSISMITKKMYKASGKMVCNVSGSGKEAVNTFNMNVKNSLCNAFAKIGFKKTISEDAAGCE